MQIDTGLVVVIVAVLIFYLRLIVIQRQRVRPPRQQSPTPGKKKGKITQPAPARSFSIVSQNRGDWVIAGIGIVLIVIGILMNRNLFPYSWAQTYWWIPVAIGIIAFSWGFK